MVSQTGGITKLQTGYSHGMRSRTRCDESPTSLVVLVKVHP